MPRTILIMFILTACVSTTIQANDFDKICHYFEELEKTSQQKSFSYQESNEFILKKISQNLDPHSAAKIASA